MTQPHQTRETDCLRRVPQIMAAQHRRLGRPLSEHDLDDLVQDVILVLLNKPERLEDPRPAGPFIQRVCRLELMNALRRRRRRPALIEDPSRLVEPRPSEAGLLADRDDLRTQIQRVGGVEAEAIRLKHFDGLTFVEMGQRLDVSANTVKTRYYKGMLQLEAILSASDEPDG